MSNPTEQLHDDLRRDKIINELQFLAEELNGELTNTTAYDSTGYEWRKITIVYDKKKREYGEPVKKVSQSRVGKDLDLI